MIYSNKVKPLNYRLLTWDRQNNSDQGRELPTLKGEAVEYQKFWTNFMQKKTENF